MPPTTGELCNILGSVEVCRITAIDDERVTVETEDGLLEVHISRIARHWMAEAFGLTQYCMQAYRLDRIENAQ